MNAKLAQQMRSANQVITEAYPFFFEAATLKQEADDAAAKAYKTRKWIYVVAAVILSAVPMVGVVLGIAAAVFFYRDYKGRFHDEVEAAREEGYAKAEAKRQEGAAIMDAHEDVLEGLYGDYCTPDATEYLTKITATGRADTLNEALLLCDDQLHRRKVEQANAAVVAEQRDQSASLRGIRKSNAVSAVANVTNTIFNIASKI